MKQQLEKYIRTFIELSEDDLAIIENIIIEKKIKKGEHFIIIGKTCEELAFFEKGYFRYYYIDKNGNEITSDFLFGPNIVTSYTSYITALPSQTYVQAMEDTNLFVLNKFKLEQLYKNNLSINKLGRKIAESISIHYEQHLLNILNKSAKERYKILLLTKPEYIEKIPLQYISSYLGIKQETLSRVRKKIKL